MIMDMKKGKVLRIEKTSIHDGDGLRTVVFLKGCPLACKWCSTPESQFRCRMEGYGMDMTVDEVIKEICKDEIFFFHSGGGVTISGGEVLMQADFVKEILKEAQKQGINTAVETSLYAPFSEIEKLLPYLSAIYADFKIFDEEKHKFYTGVSNRMIKENLKKLDEICCETVYIRIPIVPGVNMDDGNMNRTAKFLSTLRQVKNVELLPYHKLGIETYRKIGMTYELENVDTPSLDEMKRMARIIKNINPELNVKIKGELFEEEYMVC